MLYALSDAAAVVWGAALSGATAIAVALITRPSRQRTKEIAHQVRPNGGESETLADKVYRIEVKQAELHKQNDRRITRLERYMSLVLRQLRKVANDDD